MATTSALNAIVRRWLAGWLASRSLTADLSPSAPYIWVDDEWRDSEIVCTEPADLEASMAAISGNARAILTVIGLADVTPGPGTAVTREESFLTVSLPSLRAPAGTDGLTVEREYADHRVVVRLLEGDQLVSWGQVGYAGADAVFDKINTAEGHRRRGMASRLMGELTRISLDRGATTGLLIASAEGQPLYEHLGWTIAAPVHSFVGVEPGGTADVIRDESNSEQPV